MIVSDITLGLRVQVRATLLREPVNQEDGALGGWAWVRQPVEADPIVGIVAAIRTKNNGGMENVGEWDEPSYDYVARSYMRAALVYTTLYRNPIWALLDDIEAAVSPEGAVAA